MRMHTRPCSKLRAEVEARGPSELPPDLELDETQLRSETQRETLETRLREMTQGTQRDLERERAELLTSNAALQQEVTELNAYINTHLR